jgi:hypothetical protein
MLTLVAALHESALAHHPDDSYCYPANWRMLYHAVNRSIDWGYIGKCTETDDRIAYTLYLAILFS